MDSRAFASTRVSTRVSTGLRAFFLLLISVALVAPLGACGAVRSPIQTEAALGKVVVYRNGVAYFERRAEVDDGRLRITVPADRVDDFLKSLKVVDAQTQESLPVSFDTMQAGSGQTEMIVALPDKRSRELLISYVTDSPAWKPSYRIVLGKKENHGELEAWAVVDNVSGEDWKHVTVGVGSTSALSFRYDLHSVRVVERQALQDERAFAAAGPMGGSPYSVAKDEAPIMAALDSRMVDDLLSGAFGADGAGYPTVAAAAPAAEAVMEKTARTRRTAAKGKPQHDEEDETADGIGMSKAGAPDYAAFDRVAEQLKQRGGKLQIQGFGRSSDGDPQAAALKRADSVRQELVRRGVPSDAIEATASGSINDTQSVRIVSRAGESTPEQTTDEAAASLGNAYFVSKVPMTIEKNRSAMVSLLKHEARAERVYYYDPISPRGSRTFAFQAVRLDNPSDQTLDRGPFTVYSDDQFLGEGLSDTIPPHSKAFVPYALDRQVMVESQEERWEEVDHLRAVERGIAQAELHEVVATTFTVRNRGEKKTRVYVRHAIPKGAQLRAGNLEVERLGADYVLPVEVAAHGEATLRIEQALPMTRAIDLRSPHSANGVAKWLDHAATIEPSAKEQLRAVLALHTEMAELEERRATLAEQSAEYRTRVDELNDQLVSLRNVQSAAELSRKLAGKMQEISRKLQEATLRSADLQGRLMTCRIRMQDQLAELQLLPAQKQTERLAAK
jgi:outer membrane protein OmpA-like peptidoglycan-associated protein